MLRIIPLGRLTKLLFIRRFSGLPFYSATKMFRQNRRADGHGAMQQQTTATGAIRSANYTDVRAAAVSQSSLRTYR